MEQVLTESPGPRLLQDLPTIVGKLPEEQDGDVLRERISAPVEALIEMEV